MKNCFKIASLCLLGALAITGCSTEEVSNKIDCHSVCNRYQSCFDSDYDVDGCTDRCESDANADEDRESRLEMCDACIDDKSCSEATFSCADECVGIVP